MHSVYIKSKYDRKKIQKRIQFSRSDTSSKIKKTILNEFNLDSYKGLQIKLRNDYGNVVPVNNQLVVDDTKKNLYTLESYLPPIRSPRTIQKHIEQKEVSSFKV